MITNTVNMMKSPMPHNRGDDSMIPMKMMIIAAKIINSERFVRPLTIFF
jgi:hypothetical protein